MAILLNLVKFNKLCLFDHKMATMPYVTMTRTDSFAVALPRSEKFVNKANIVGRV